MSPTEAVHGGGARGARGVRAAVVADDLTGAADTAVQFASAGWPTRLALHLDDLGDVRGALAVSTDARAMGEGARAATADAVRALRDRGAGRLYLKIDSTLRGAVADEIAGALDGWDADLALVCPAYPAMGRVVRAGVASADGRALEEGPAGRDPVTPVTTSVLTELLPGAVHLSADRYSCAVELLDAAKAAGAAVVCLDAGDDGDLDVVADAVVLAGERVVAVGSAGLARALAVRWRSCDPLEAVACEVPHGDGPVVVMVTSLHEVAAGQVRHLMDKTTPGVVHLQPATADLGESAIDGWLRQLHVPAGQDDVVVISAPSQRSGDVDATRVAGAMAETVAYLHRITPLRGVVAVGGDGASALARRWSATTITVHGSVAEGVPHGVLDGGQTGALRVVTKAGGFGAPDALVAAVTHLLAPTAPREDQP